jgi:hypothetical protein
VLSLAVLVCLGRNRRAAGAWNSPREVVRGEPTLRQSVFCLMAVLSAAHHEPRFPSSFPHRLADRQAGIGGHGEFIPTASAAAGGGQF